jgi:hypothetical protein
LARAIGKLTALAVSRARKRGYLADGGGLYLQVSPNGAKSWVFRFRDGGKLREAGLGAVHTFGLAEAREKARLYRQARYDGIDPIEARKAERAAQRLEAAKAMSFEQCAQAYVAAHRAGWRNAKHAAQWPATLATYVYPVFGELPVQVVDVGLVMKAIEPIWSTKPETASRVRGRIESVLDWATVRQYRQGENPARWKGHLENLLTAPSKAKRAVRQAHSKGEHHAALPYAKVAAFMVELREQEGVAARALEFAILTAGRTGEVLGARWDEIDMSNRLWIVPPERMKAVGYGDGDPARDGQGSDRRFRVSRRKGGPAARQHCDAHAAGAHGARRSNCAWFPIDLSRLVRREDELSGRGCRNGAGAHCRRQG